LESCAPVALTIELDLIVRALEILSRQLPSSCPLLTNSSPLITLLQKRCRSLWTPPQPLPTPWATCSTNLQELTKCQNALEHTINATLTDLTAQLQQLTQLMTSPAPAPTVALPPIPTSPPPISPFFPVLSALSKQWTRPKLPSPLDFSGKRSFGQVFLNSCMLYLCLAPEQFSCDKEKIFWTLVFFKDEQVARWSENYHKWSLTICDECFDTSKSSKMRSKASDKRCC